MVREGSDGLWAWGSVTEAPELLQNIHPKSAVTYQGASMKTSGSEAKVRTVRAWGGPIVSPPIHTEGQDKHIDSACLLLHGLNLWINNPPSSGLAPQIRIHFI